LPKWFCVGTEDRFGAFFDALFAESALAAPEIDFRESGCTAYDDALRTGVDAFPAGRAAFDEFHFTHGPGRTYRHRCRYRHSSE
jgi:hypothetical protein